MVDSLSQIIKLKWFFFFAKIGSNNNKKKVSSGWTFNANGCLCKRPDRPFHTISANRNLSSGEFQASRNPQINGFRGEKKEKKKL